MNSQGRYSANKIILFVVWFIVKLSHT
jgi:hypothetical protein